MFLGLDSLSYGHIGGENAIKTLGYIITHILHASTQLHASFLQTQPHAPSHLFTGDTHCFAVLVENAVLLQYL